MERVKSLIKSLSLVVLGVSLGIFLEACRAISHPVPNVDLYYGDSSVNGLRLRDSDEIIRCDSERVNELICFTHAGIECIYQAWPLNCLEWEDPNYQCKYKEETVSCIDWERINEKESCKKGQESQKENSKTTTQD